MQRRRRSAAGNASPVVLTVPAAPPSGTEVGISGATAGWTGINGTFTATQVDAADFSIPVDSTAFGALSGSPLAFYLAAAGIGTLGLVDFDVVDASNL